MVDLKELEKNFDEVSEKLKIKKIDIELLKSLKDKFAVLKKQKGAVEELRATQNKNSKLFPIYQKEKKDISELKKILSKNKQDITIANDKLRVLEEELNFEALKIPNLADKTVPFGNSEDDNIEIKKVLDIPKFDFKPKNHWDLTDNFIDFERGVKIAKSRFSTLVGNGARLQRALINYFLDFNRERGYNEIVVPYIVNRNTMKNTGQLPKFEDDLFKIEGEEMFLIPTAEVPVTNFFSDEILNADELPIKLTSYSSCFRKEAGSAGKDTRGIIRQHQFDKVEIVVFSKPEDSWKMLEEMSQMVSELLTSLKLPHRLINLCGGDLGFSSAKTIDLEVWLPGQNRYREVSSVSNMTDFQARRAKIRYKDGKKNRLVHTLNGSSLAVGRTLVAIMENYQKADGSIEIPEVLKKYIS